MFPEFQIGDEVYLDGDTSVYDYLPEMLSGIAGTVMDVQANYEDFDDESGDPVGEIIFYEYWVHFPIAFPSFGGDRHTAWIVGEELKLAKKKEVRKTGFSKFIQRIEKS